MLGIGPCGKQRMLLMQPSKSGSRELFGQLGRVPCEICDSEGKS